jgi:3',5'-cyclic AMP phosphodiesterase CpdA
MTDASLLTSRRIRLAVVSDLHVFDRVEPDATEPSYISTNSPDQPENQHPISSLRRLIRDEQLKADYLVCCGDMGDKASAAGIKYCWDKLHLLVQELGARRLICTPGNHDMDSRAVADHDAKGLLQSLSPAYPVTDPSEWDHFWARNYLILREPNVRFLVLNTAAYHGYSDTNGEPEYEHGRVSFRTLEKIEDSLKRDATEYPANVLVCHHHPFRYPELAKDYSEMRDGNSLIQMLNRSTHRWLILHGHKHLSRISYGPGGSNSPTVLAAGSFSAVSDAHPKFSNQFQIVELALDDMQALNLDLAGRFTVWEWGKGTGWTASQSLNGLPHTGGFGYKPELQSLARALRTWLPTDRVVAWADVVRQFPSLQFAIPDDVENLRTILIDRHGVRIARSPRGVITELFVARA